MNRRERMIATAILNLAFVITLFFEWSDGPNGRGWDQDSAWLALVAAVVSALILLAEAFDYELPRFPVAGVAAFLTSLTLFWTLASLIDRQDQAWGIVVALIVVILATILAVSVWLGDRRVSGPPPAR
ncbi:MAG: hypothetical protein MUE51_06785 [Thermoleophilia bacterium]|jgi:hypothetical protein|nr:hypothetical protein [Thermoleophilia bacterium]